MPREVAKERGTARPRVRDCILQGTLGGTYAPGSRLRQLRLASDFGVAQSVVREALPELQFCGLVEVVDNRGVFASELGEAGEREAMGVLDRQFHLRMIVVSADEVLQRLTEGYRVLGMAVQAERDIRKIRDENLGIVAAVEANRPDEAEKLAREHVRRAPEVIGRKIKKGPFQPRWIMTGPEDVLNEALTPRTGA